MKTPLFFVISIFIHVIFSGALWYFNKDGDHLSKIEIVDLTLNSEMGLSSEKVAGAEAVAKKSNPQTEPPISSVSAIRANATTTLESAPASPTREDPVSAEGRDDEGFGGATVGLSDVTQLPKVTTEVKATYPTEAKDARVEGPVVLDVIIDHYGKVREVHLVRGPGYGLNESAIDALKKFEFRPAMKGRDAVAVKIRYTYRFKLGIN